MTDSKTRILVVDDEQSMCELLSVLLAKQGYVVDTALDAESGMDCFSRNSYDLVIQDLRMPRVDGIELLRRVKQRSPETVVIVMTAYSSWDTAVEAMRLGAYDYIRKPFDNAEVRSVILRALDQKRIQKELGTQHDQGPQPLRNMIGHTPKLLEIFALIERVAPTDSTVLIEGESGTGKNLVARALHYGSSRKDMPFVSADCGAFPESLLESELFGHVKGAFTGAVADKKGLFEVADGGTFFLDEISEMSANTQVKLLRMLEDREFRAVGSTETKHIDVRFIAATNTTLADEVERGRFREDLFYRLNVITIGLPPLRERREDIPLLAGHFLATYAKAMRKNTHKISAPGMHALMTFDWPGNVRELENTIQRAVAMAKSEEIDLSDLKGEIGSAPLRTPTFLEEIPPQGLDLEARLAEVEQRYLLAALARTGWHLGNAAELLGISFRSMRYKVKKHGLTRD